MPFDPPTDPDGPPAGPGAPGPEQGPEQGPGQGPQGPQGPGRPFYRRVGFFVLLALLAAWIVIIVVQPRSNPATNLSYTSFLSQADSGKVKTATIDSNGAITGTLSDGKSYTSQVPTALGQQTGLIAQLQKDKVDVSATPPSGSIGSVLLYFLPFLLLIGFYFFIFRRGSSQLGAMGGIGRSRTKVTDTERPSTTFADVAGYAGVKQEVSEIIDFLRTPERFTRAGAAGPRGVLMLGPPGTGKTLLARAMAGEASVPFLSVTGSSFVEMFVGVGAARVRDLFENARKMAPCIIFIDEIDAIGQRRGGGMVANDEREQTLDQLLAEMDGFDPSEGIVVLAATNRPEVLDPALLRPGRFDRQILVPLPTRSDRLAILEVHCRRKKLGPDVDLDVVARGTPGFSGADLANLTNEAAICAVRDGREVIEARDFDDARDRVLLGQRDRSGALLADERRRVAVHESGHAVMAALLEEVDPVSKVSILPAGQALGVTQQLPIDERHLFSESHLKAVLAVRLGGRAAELVELGQGSTGAADDLAGATDLATRMVREFGLSPELGPVGYSTGSPMYLGGEQVSMRSYSEGTQRVMDQAVARLVVEAEGTAVSMLTAHRDELGRVTAELMEHETIDGSVVYAIVRGPDDRRAGPDGSVAGEGDGRRGERPTGGPPERPPVDGVPGDRVPRPTRSSRS